jgi:bifunctional non-homologous end joining protein LigD
MHLKSFPKLTGGKGLHITIPIVGDLTWEELTDVSHALVDDLVAQFPRDLTSDSRKRSRKGKIFVDYLRNAYSATTIAPYSPRARSHAPIALPIGWGDLDPKLEPDAITLRDLDKWLARHRADPWRKFESSRVSLRFIDRLLHDDLAGHHRLAQLDRAKRRSRELDEHEH